MYEWLIGKDLEGSGPHLIEVLSQNWLEGTEENHKNLRIAGRDYDYITFFLIFSLECYWISTPAEAIGMKLIFRTTYKVKLADHLHLVPRLRIHGAILQLPRTSRLTGAQWITGTTLPLTFYSHS
jgi:hypothetical protein